MDKEYIFGMLCLKMLSGLFDEERARLAGGPVVYPPVP